MSLPLRQEVPFDCVSSPAHASVLPTTRMDDVALDGHITKATPFNPVAWQTTRTWNTSLNPGLYILQRHGRYDGFVVYHHSSLLQASALVLGAGDLVQSGLWHGRFPSLAAKFHGSLMEACARCMGNRIYIYIIYMFFLHAFSECS